MSQRERVLPDGCRQIILDLSCDYLTDCGEDGKAHENHPPGIIVGVRHSYQVLDKTNRPAEIKPEAKMTE